MTGARGEGFIEFEGEQLSILFTNRALAEVEQATGKTVLQLAMGMKDGQVGMNEVAHLLHRGLEHGRREVNPGRKPYRITDMWGILDALGFVPVMRVVAIALSAVLSYRGDGAGGQGTDPMA